MWGVHKQHIPHLGSMLIDQAVAPEERRPYEAFFKKRAREAERRSATARFFKERIRNSLFFMGAGWLVPLFCAQLLLLFSLQFNLFSIGVILPVDPFLFVSVIGLFFGLLLSLTLSNVVNNGKAALHSMVQDLFGKMDDFTSVMLPALNDSSLANTTTPRYEVKRYRENGIILKEKLTIVEILKEQRDILVTRAYLVPKSGREAFRIYPERITTLTKDLKAELTHAVLPEYDNNDLFLTRLLFMYDERLDTLHREGALNGGMQTTTYRQAQDLGTASGNVSFAASDLNQPIPLLDALLITGWVLMIYYVFVLFDLYGFFGTAALVWIPNLFIHGMLWFAKLYNNPFELSLDNKLAGVDIRLMTHTSVRNFDLNLMHALCSVSTT